jgi:ribosomal protein L7Ae-like RNA K-turn-binding protein
VRFQDRLYHKDPVKAKAKRRIVLGLREVTKHLKLKKIKFVIISPNMERVKAKGKIYFCKVEKICRVEVAKHRIALLLNLLCDESVI